MANREHSYKLNMTENEYKELMKQAEDLGITGAVLIRSALVSFYSNPHPEVIGKRKEAI